MESDGLIGRIGTSDFFSVLPGGFFVLLMAAVTLYMPPQAHDLIEAIKQPADGLKDHPYYVGMTVFAAFLIGSVIRSLPVHWAERASPPFNSRFPFNSELQNALDNLKSHPRAAMYCAAAVPDLSKGINGDIWNFWKDTLCCRNQKAFQYYQSFEIRARYSAGLVWAGIAGMLMGIIMFLRCPPIAWQVVGVSAAIYLAYSYHLRRMRGNEARALLFLFIAQQQIEQSEIPGSAHPKHENKS